MYANIKYVCYLLYICVTYVVFASCICSFVNGCHQIGSLARLTCFCNRVDLSSILWSISKPFSRILFFCRRWRCNYLWFFSSNFHQLSGCSVFNKGRTPKEPFLRTFLVYGVIFLLNWYFVNQVLPWNIICDVIMISLVWLNVSICIND